jgi:hypothetical protein
MKHLVALIVLAACGESTPPLAPLRTAEDAPALDALRAAKFDEAVRLATLQLAIEPRDAEASAIRAIANYIKASSTIYVAMDVHHSWFVIDKAFEPNAPPIINLFTDQLGVIDRDLAVAGADPRFSLELCLACWSFDWNHDGKIDERDSQLFELEEDSKGKIPRADPRRRPTFRFDVGDVSWARAMISFQRALGELLLAYRWSDVMHTDENGVHPDPFVIHLTAPERVKHARELVLAGLEFSDQSRLQYLAETDDDREWVPNPSQKNYAMPLPVDAKLYETWAGVVRDVRGLVAGRTGVSMRELARLDGNKLAAITPDAFVDLGRMLSEPTDIVIPKHESGNDLASMTKILHGLLGRGYSEHMTSSPLVRRLAAMREDLDKGSDTLDHKLHYLLWIN